ncbi:MAG: TonB-dependent receptor plug domain-containing protein, partial [Chitinophagaceae bacterium]
MIQIPLFKPLALVFTKKGYRECQQNVHLTKASPLFLRVILKPAIQQLQEVVVTDEKERREAGKVQLDASKAIINPSPIGGIESLIKTLVGSNNELSSQYNVRGGSYDENLVVVNDFEIFRPYLVSSGQQEGLSFINPELTGNVKFYTGGFAAKYGDKLSSVLDIGYFKPKQKQGGAYIGLLEQGIHFGGVSNSSKFSYLFGARNRSNRNLLNSQSTRGNYIPSSADVQTLLTYQFNKKWNAELLLNFSSTRFQFFPEESKLTSAVFTNNYASFLGVNTYFEGQERDSYRTNFVGFSIANQPNARFRLKWMFSRLVNTEAENVDITGSYIFGDIEMNRSS